MWKLQVEMVVFYLVMVLQSYMLHLLCYIFQRLGVLE